MLTLRAWRERFEAASERLDQLGYDERFRRTWRFYLAISEAGFAETRIRDVQMLFAKPRWSGTAATSTPSAPSASTTRSTSPSRSSMTRLRHGAGAEPRRSSRFAAASVLAARLRRRERNRPRAGAVSGGVAEPRGSSPGSV